MPRKLTLSQQRVLDLIRMGRIGWNYTGYQPSYAYFLGQRPGAPRPNMKTIRSLAGWGLIRLPDRLDDDRTIQVM